MNPIDISLYLVLDPDLCDGLDGMVETARIAAEQGVTVVQLRAPQWKKRQWLLAARRLKAVLTPLGVPLIINDHVDIALAVDADGVHVGQSDLPVEDVRALLGPDKLVGLSANGLAHVTHLPAGVDYIGIGPVYPTRTKQDASPVIGAKELAAMVAASPVPAVTIGGIKAGMIASQIHAGAGGVAVVSAICGQPDIAAATRQLHLEIKQAKEQQYL